MSSPNFSSNLDHQRVKISIAGFNVLLHSTGCYLLWKTYKWSQVTTQQLIILNLSIAEGLINLFLLVMRAISWSKWEQLAKVYSWFAVPVQFALLYVIFFIMLFMTLDRLIAVVFNLKYQIYWRVGRTKKVLTAIWMVGLLGSVCCGLIQQNTPRSILNNILTSVERGHLLLVFSVVFVVTAILTYATIFWKYRKSRNSLRNDSSNKSEQQHSQFRFHIPMLIIFTHLIFNAIPLIIWIAHEKNNFWAHVSTELVLLGYVSDGLIYIFLQPRVRQQIYVC